MKITKIKGWQTLSDDELLLEIMEIVSQRMEKAETQENKMCFLSIWLSLQ